jgi:N-acetylmuramoyl-L-alanine amidase
VGPSRPSARDPSPARTAARRARSARRQTQIRRRRLVLVGVVAVGVVVAVLVGVGRTSTRPHADEGAGTAKGSVERARTAARRQATNAGLAIDPAYFATGACMSFAPTSGDRHLVVFLDAGHGGVDPGGTGTTESGQAISEANLTLPVELDTMALLRAQGFTVVVSRTSDTTVLRLRSDDISEGSLTLIGTHDDEAARDVCANEAHADALVGIYFDAGASADNAGSVTGYDRDRPFWRDNMRLAQLVQTDVLAAMNAHGWGIPDEGTLPDSGLGSVAPTDNTSTGLAAEALAYNHLLLLGPAEAGYFSTPSQMPGALIEPLYLTDPFEGSIADSSAGQQAIAAGLARALEQYFAPPTEAS